MKGFCPKANKTKKSGRVNIICFLMLITAVPESLNNTEHAVKHAAPPIQHDPLQLVSSLWAPNPIFTSITLPLKNVVSKLIDS